MSQLATFKDYCNIGFDKNEALKMAGLTEKIVSENQDFFKPKTDDNIDDIRFDTGIPNDLNMAYGKIMDNYAVYLDITKSHDETLNRLSEMFDVELAELKPFVDKNKKKYLKENYPQFLSILESETEISIPTIWNGYCPESWAKGKIVRMRRNRFESSNNGKITFLRTHYF
ncbi:MAG: hypothetical protein L6262_04130 [Weeksellaceae bacterium]|nr:hypothetical protein [Weeksellaceae bacterium]